MNAETNVENKSDLLIPGEWTGDALRRSYHLFHRLDSPPRNNGKKTVGTKIFHIYP